MKFTVLNYDGISTVGIMTPTKRKIRNLYLKIEIKIN